MTESPPPTPEWQAHAKPALVDRIGPRVWWIVAGILVLLGVWALIQAANVPQTSAWQSGVYAVYFGIPCLVSAALLIRVLLRRRKR